MEKLVLTKDDIRFQVNQLYGTIVRNHTLTGQVTFFGVPRGGIPVAYMLSRLWAGSSVTYDAAEADIIVDDLTDSGNTLLRYKNLYPAKPFYALYDKREAFKGTCLNPRDDRWYVFPWETEGEDDRSATDIITRLLQYIGEDPTREGLRDTPQRVLKAWKEWASGYAMNPGDVFKSFEDGSKGYDELVVVHNVPVVSKCEHHMADITGIAHVCYIPNGRIVGLSKLARITDLFARRLQVQERLTVQIADAIVTNLMPKGVGVIIRASHACMSSRGVKIHGSVTTTSAMRGALLDKPSARQEFLDLCALAEKA